MTMLIQKPIQFVLRLCEWTGKASFFVACILISLLVLLIFAGSVSRYLMGVPIAFVDETASLLFLSGTVLTLTYGYFKKSLIRIELIWQNLPEKPKEIADILGLLVASVAFLIIARATFGFAWDSYSFGSKTSLTNVPLWPWAMCIPFSLSLLSLSMFLSGINQILNLINNAGKSTMDQTLVG